MRPGDTYTYFVNGAPVWSGVVADWVAEEEDVD